MITVVIIVLYLFLSVFHMPAVTEVLPLRQAFMWSLKPDGTYQLSDRLFLRETENGLIQPFCFGPAENPPEYEPRISSGGDFCYILPYYSQKDRRWSRRMYGSYTFGSTGCVPTALAMIISGIRGTEILPPEVGDYLYYGTDQFNRMPGGGYGASSMAVVLAAEHYNINYQILRSREDFINALKEGKCVYLAVNYIRGLTHAYVCLGYHNGFTFVKDSDDAALSHLYDAEQLWNLRSDNRFDSNAGSPAIALWQK